MNNILSGFLLAGAGGFLGAGLRYLVYQILAVVAGACGAVWATFSVNILGSFVIGWLSSIWLLPHHPVRIFVVVGVLGGFTTFSSFSADMFHLLQAGRWGWAAVYAGGSVCLGLLAALAGFALCGAYLK